MLFRKKRRPSESIVKRLLELAIETHHNTFDLSVKSIEDLGGLLEEYHRDLLEQNPTDKQVWSVAMIYGAYLGETMLQKCSFGAGIPVDK